MQTGRCGASPMTGGQFADPSVAGDPSAHPHLALDRFVCGSQTTRVKYRHHWFSGHLPSEDHGPRTGRVDRLPTGTGKVHAAMARQPVLLGWIERPPDHRMWTQRPVEPGIRAGRREPWRDQCGGRQNRRCREANRPEGRVVPRCLAGSLVAITARSPPIRAPGGYHTERSGIRVIAHGRGTDTVVWAAARAA